MTITVVAPVIPNGAPVVSISGGNRSISDTDSAAERTVSFIATATDSDGSIASTTWLIGGEEVVNENWKKCSNSPCRRFIFASLSLANGTNIVTFRATDDDGNSTSTSVTITVVAPPGAPVVSISGGNRSISDTDSAAGETVSFIATATDSDGSITSTTWLIGGEVVASGTSADLTLANGTNIVTFRATDDDGNSTSTSVTITVSAPVVANVAPVVTISGGDRTVSDSDASAGETVSLSASATDSDGSVSSTEWLVNGSVVATGTSANLSLSDGATEVTSEPLTTTVTVQARV